MKVLHYIPNFKKSMGQAARFVQMLQVVMGKTVETHIISGNISNADFFRRIEKLQPDVIHIHGCWSLKAAIVESWALRSRIPVVLSPHNGLSPKELQADFWKRKLPCLIAYQFLAIRKAMVLHATSSQELEDIKQLGWKKRVALIPEPSNENEYQQTTETFRALYQKVIDTVQRNKLSEKEEKCICTLLLAAINMRHASHDAEAKHVQNTTAAHSQAQECPDMLQQLSVHNWKNIQIYAIDHGIMEELLSGAKALSLHLPIHVDALPARFKVKSTISDGHISDKEHGIICGCTSSQETAALITDLLKLSKILEKNQYNKEWQPPFVLVMSIYERLMYSMYDEDIFCNMVRKLGMESFCAHVMHILSERLQLPLGYMPLDPISGKTARRLYRQLNEFNISKETT